jgi:hypothetical protein
MPDRVLDYSAGIPGAAAIKAAGFKGAVRYIGLPGFTKNTDAAELADFDAHGLGMALVFEWHAHDWRGGHAAGVRYYRQARNHANAIGFPASRPIYMAVDQDVVTPAEFQAAVDYIAGAIDAAGGRQDLVGTYGEHDVVRAVRARFPGSWSWQCRAWSGTPVRLYAGRHIYQHVGLVHVRGIAADFNDVLADDWGQHNYRKPPMGGGGVAPLPWWHDRTETEVADFISLEVIEANDTEEGALPLGFGVFIDLTNRIATGTVAANLRASAAQARTFHMGVSALELRHDWLGKYGLPVPKPTDAVLFRIEQAKADDDDATATSADQRAASQG